MRDSDVLAMPARRFWAMDGMISAIKADDDLRKMRNHQTTQDESAFKAVQEEMRDQVESVLVFEVNLNPKRDTDIGDKLKKAMGN